MAADDNAFDADDSEDDDNSFDGMLIADDADNDDNCFEDKDDFDFLPSLETSTEIKTAVRPKKQILQN